MEFRAQDQMRATSATATSSLGFNTSSSHNLTKADHHHQSPGGAERRRSSSISNTHNGNSTPTGLMINTPAIATQTLDQNFQPTARALQPAAQPQAPARDLEITPPSGAKPKTATSSSSSAAAAAAAKYKECLKNHAASVGGSVFDGCGEFMPSGEEGSLEALKCAACQCHRNFHRKEVDGEAAGQLLYSPGSRRSSTNAATNALMLNPLQLTTPLALPSPTGLHHLHHHHHHNPHHPHHHKYPIVQPMSVAYGGGGGGNESSSEELNAGYGGSADNSAPPYHHPQQPFGMSKKRYRTKFTQDQKERMLEFAERVGWRLQKQDEEEVERFCAEVGVKRQVLKVWMHNNKSTNVNKTKQQLEHVNAMMGNLGNTVLSAANDDDANMINQVSADDQLEEGELDT